MKETMIENFEDKSIEDLRKHFNRLAEKYGWKTIPKGSWRKNKARLAQQVKDLQDCIKAKIIQPVAKPVEEKPINRRPY